MNNRLNIIRDIFSFLYLKNHTINSNCCYLLTNNDGFLSRLDKINLYARNCRTIKEYKSKIMRCIYKPNVIDRLQIHLSIESIKRWLLKSNEWLDINLFKKLPWNIIITNDDTYEYGLPHTRLNHIVINCNDIYSKDLPTILFHEQLHIYQKNYSKKVNEYIIKKFTKVGVHKPMDRVNPDTDDYLYLGFNSSFRSTKPKNLLDVEISDPKYDHPLEFMVYDYINNSIIK